MWKKKWIENGCVSFAFKYLIFFKLAKKNYRVGTKNQGQPDSGKRLSFFRPKGYQGSVIVRTFDKNILRTTWQILITLCFFTIFLLLTFYNISIFLCYFLIICLCNLICY